MTTTTSRATEPSQPSEHPTAKSRKGSSRRKSQTAAPRAKESRPAEASVNLLSPWVFEDLRVHQLRRRFLLAAIVLVAVIALVWAGLRFNLHRANDELRGEDAVTTGLTNQISELTPVRTYVDSVTRRVVTVHGATYDDVAFSRVLAALSAATPADADVESISVTLASTASDGTAPAPDAAADPARGLVGSTCPGPDPFGTKVVVGCMTIQGTADSRDAVSKLVIALGADGVFVEPFIDTTTTSDATQVTFSGSVGLSPKVFSGRYDSLGDELTKGAKQ